MYINIFSVVTTVHTMSRYIRLQNYSGLIGTYWSTHWLTRISGIKKSAASPIEEQKHDDGLDDAKTDLGAQLTTYPNLRRLFRNNNVNHRVHIYISCNWDYIQTRPVHLYNNTTDATVVTRVSDFKTMYYIYIYIEWRILTIRTIHHLCIDIYILNIKTKPLRNKQRRQSR